MSIWKETVHFASGKDFESFNPDVKQSVFAYIACGWIRKPGDDENSFFLINPKNVDCIEFERVDE